MEFAKTKIPASEVARTPMFLMATAGLRMVGEAAKDAILASVCSYLSSTGYLFRCGWATLLDGRDEGLYGWVTVNYLLNALYPGGQEASGIIDLGGGSVQIVFPTTIPSPPTSPAVAALTQTLDFNGATYTGPRAPSHALEAHRRPCAHPTLRRPVRTCVAARVSGRQHPIYVKSHLGYGLDAARNAVLDLLVSKGKDPAVHPCLPKGATATHKGVALTGSGDHHKCKKLVKRIFHDDDCVYGKHLCSINGVCVPAARSLTTHTTHRHARSPLHQPRVRTHRSL
jgi:Golgi apyrase